MHKCINVIGWRAHRGLVRRLDIIDHGHVSLIGRTAFDPFANVSAVGGCYTHPAVEIEVEGVIKQKYIKIASPLMLSGQLRIACNYWQQPFLEK